MERMHESLNRNKEAAGVLSTTKRAGAEGKGCRFTIGILTYVLGVAREQRRKGIGDEEIKAKL